MSFPSGHIKIAHVAAVVGAAVAAVIGSAVVVVLLPIICQREIVGSGIEIYVFFFLFFSFGGAGG